MDLGASPSDQIKADNLATVVDVAKTVGIMHPMTRGPGLFVHIGMAINEFLRVNYVNSFGALVVPVAESRFKAVRRSAVIPGEVYVRGAAAYGELTSRAFNAGISDKAPQ
jgi:hypothetical protein